MSVDSYKEYLTSIAKKYSRSGILERALNVSDDVLPGVLYDLEEIYAFAVATGKIPEDRKVTPTYFQYVLSKVYEEYVEYSKTRSTTSMKIYLDSIKDDPLLVSPVEVTVDDSPVDEDDPVDENNSGEDNWDDPVDENNSGEDNWDDPVDESSTSGGIGTEGDSTAFGGYEEEDSVEEDEDSVAEFDYEDEDSVDEGSVDEDSVAEFDYEDEDSVDEDSVAEFDYEDEDEDSVAEFDYEDENSVDEDSVAEFDYEDEDSVDEGSVAEFDYEDEDSVDEDEDQPIKTVGVARQNPSPFAPQRSGVTPPSPVKIDRNIKKSDDLYNTLGGIGDKVYKFIRKK